MLVELVMVVVLVMGVVEVVMGVDPVSGGARDGGI